MRHIFWTWSDLIAGYGTNITEWNNGTVSITDRYDFALNADYEGIAGTAVNTMWLAQSMGVIIPFLVVIKLISALTIKAITDETTSKLIPLHADQGYFMIRDNQTNASISGTNVFESSFDNVMIGMMDLDNNRIYFLSYNM